MMDTQVISPIIDAKQTEQYARLVGKTAQHIASTVAPSHITVKAIDMAYGQHNQYAQFAGITTTGSFLWNTGVGMWATN